MMQIIKSTSQYWVSDKIKLAMFEAIAFGEPVKINDEFWVYYKPSHPDNIYHIWLADIWQVRRLKAKEGGFVTTKLDKTFLSYSEAISYISVFLQDTRS